MRILERALESSGAYELSRRIIGAHREMELLCTRVVQPRPGLSVLDFGCGNGRLVRFLPEGSYVGIDSNPSYIEAATAEHSDRPNASFVCGDLFDVPSLEVEPVDVVVCIGVLHHLDDETANRALTSAKALLAPGGRLVTMDPCFEPTQRSTARVLMALDRGRFVRHPSHYGSLVTAVFGGVSQRIWSDVYRFPYTHVVQEADRPVT